MIAVMAILGMAAAIAQPRAIGANVGSGVGFSYQHGFGESNMLDVAASIPVIYKGLGIGGHVTYDWIDPFGASVPWSGKGAWDWYMGVGGAGGAYGLFSSDAANYWYAGVAGHIGIEYNINHFNLSFDYRPCIGVDNVNDGQVGFGLNGLYGNIAIGLRYKF